MTTIGSGLRIAEVAARTGFPAATLRYYEDIGLLATRPRTSGGYRIYDERDVRRLTFIARAKQLGCSLDEIAGLLEAWDTDRCGPVKHRLRELVSVKAAETRSRIAELVAFAADLGATGAVLDELPVDGPCDDSCGCTQVAAGGSVLVPLIDKATATGSVPPIACSLGAGDMNVRMEEWQALLAQVSSRVAIAGGIRLAFSERAPLAEIGRLADAEHDCCRFFSFAITVDDRGVGLEVRAPDGADELVAALFGGRRSRAREADGDATGAGDQC